MELWAFLLLGLGLVFIALEVFFPSFGILGTIAAACVITGGVLAFRVEGSTFIVYLMLAFLLGPTVAMIGLKLFPKTPIGRKLTLAGSTFNPLEASAGGAEYRGLLDQKGVAQTTLRPAGKALLDGRRVDVTTRGEMIDAGRPVKVVRVEGNRVFVAEDRE